MDAHTTEKLKDKAYVDNMCMFLLENIDMVFPGLISKAIFKRKLQLDTVIGFYLLCRLT